MREWYSNTTDDGGVCVSEVQGGTGDIRLSLGGERVRPSECRQFRSAGDTARPTGGSTAAV